MKIILSPLAQWKIEGLLEYLETEWSTKSKQKFWARLLQAFDQVSEHPKSAPQSTEFSGIYRKIVTKQTSMFYRLKNDTIEIIDLIDNRQDPNEILRNIKKHFG